MTKGLDKCPYSYVVPFDWLDWPASSPTSIGEYAGLLDYDLLKQVL